MYGDTKDAINRYGFAAASPQERTVFGAARPGSGSPVITLEDAAQWLAFMCSHAVKRVVCLLSREQLSSYGMDLPALYREHMGDEAVCWSPVPDGRLASADQLMHEILPFLRAADEAEERVVVHCSAGLGRTGHVLAAWLVHGRSLQPEDALQKVRLMGRRPTEAVEWGNATREELMSLLEACAR